MFIYVIHMLISMSICAYLCRKYSYQLIPTSIIRSVLTFLYAALTLFQPIPEHQVIRHIVFPFYLFVHLLPCGYKVTFPKFVDGSLEIIVEVTVFIYRQPNVLHHFFFLLFAHSIIEILRVRCRHQRNAVFLQPVFSKVSIVPDFHLTIFIEGDMVIGDGEGTVLVIEFVESN